MGIYKRGNNYYVQVKVNGERIIKSAGPDRRAAEVMLAELKREAGIRRLAGKGYEFAQAIRDSRRQLETFEQAAQSFIEQRASAKPATLASYESVLTTYLIPEFGKLRLGEISESHIRKFQAKLITTPGARGKAISSTTANNIVAPLRAILSQAFREAKIVRDPSKAVKREDREPADIDPLSESELASVLSKIDSHYYPLFCALAYTGARPSEMQALRWDDIDWSRHEIRISKGRVRGHERKPKTKSSIRRIPMPPELESILHELQLKQSKQKVVNHEAYVFTKPDGQPINKHLDRVWKQALKHAGLRHRPSYQLRHTWASLCLLKGLHPGFVSKVLGHSTLETTYRYYARWINDASAQQVEKLNAVFTIQPSVQQKVQQQIS